MDWASFGHVTIGAARRALSAFVLTLTYSRMDLPAVLPRPVAGELPARPRVRIRGPSGGPPSSALRQPALGGDRAARGGRALQPPSARAGLSLPLRAAGVPAGARQREGRGRADRALRARLVLRRALVHDARGPEPPGAACGGTRSPRAAAGPGTTARRWPRPSRRSGRTCSALPAHPFETDLVVPVRSDKTIYVRFDLNDYSIPPASVGRALTPGRFRDHGAHPRRLESRSLATAASYDRHRRIDDPAHVEALLDEKQRAQGSTPQCPAHRCRPRRRGLPRGGLPAGRVRRQPPPRSCCSCSTTTERQSSAPP